MLKVSMDVFEQARKSYDFVELAFGDTIKSVKGDSTFYGAEISGNRVLVLQMWNNDFCTSSFVVPDAQIVCAEVDGGLKYTVASIDVKGMNHVPDFKVLKAKKDDIDGVPAMKMYDDESGDASLDQRMDMIDGNIWDGAATAEPRDPKPADKPIVTKGRQKAEEDKTPPPREVVKSQPKFVPREERVPVSKPYAPEPPRMPKPEYRPAPPPVEDDFGGW